MNSFSPNEQAQMILNALSRRGWWTQFVDGDLWWLEPLDVFEDPSRVEGDAIRPHQRLEDRFEGRGYIIAENGQVEFPAAGSTSFDFLIETHDLELRPDHLIEHKN